MKVHTIDGQEHSARIYLDAGVSVLKRLPKEVAAGMWIDEKTFIPGTAITRVEIVAGQGAQFPK